MSYTYEELEARTPKQLLAIFNEEQVRLGGTAINGPVPRESLINRIRSLQNLPTPSAPEPEAVSDPEPQDSVEVRTEDEVAPRKRGRRPLPRGVYNLEPGPVQRPFRAGSGRGRLLAILTEDGATFDELLPQFPQWDRDQVHNTIRMCARWLGYTITTDEAGVIRASR